MTLTARAPADTDRSPTEQMLTAFLVVAPLLYLLVDTLYATRGWDDGTAGVLHVLGGVAYGFVLVRIASWATGWLAAATLFTGIVGACGNVAYGINTIHVSLGATDLVDQSGAATIIKPLGLFCPLAFLLAAVVVTRGGRARFGLAIGVAAILWPVAHIANIGWLAVAVNVLLVVGIVPLTWLGLADDARAR
ncbi:MAG: hypothetical protein JO291_10995 [Acidimicrobiia bacterium]|nr:hypothetical protein [Acidimicrobiia bacterium]